MRESSSTSVGNGLALLSAAACGALNLDGRFVFDDENAIVHSPVVQGAVPLHEAFVRDFWGTPLAEGITTYRPLATLLLRAEYAVGGGAPLVFRVVTLVLHVLATGLLITVARRLGASRLVATMAGVIFAVHGAHAEAIGANVAQADILGTALGLAALVVVARPEEPNLRHATSAAVLVVLASFVKESAVLFGPACALVVALRSESPMRERAQATLPPLVVTLIVVALQLSFTRATIEWSNNIAYDMTLGSRQVLALAVIGRAAALCFVPTGLSPTHGYAVMDGSLETLLPHAIPGVIVLVALVAALIVAIKRRAVGLAVTLAILCGTLVLVSNSLVVLPALLPERVLYPAVAAASVLTAVAIARIFAAPRARIAATASSPFSSPRRPSATNGPGARRALLWAHAVEMEPLSVTARYNFANVSLDAGHIDSALYNRALASSFVEHYPERIDPEPVFVLDALPPAEAWRALPARMFPNDPCQGVRGLLGVVQRTLEPAFTTALSGWRERYPECFGVAATPSSRAVQGTDRRGARASRALR